MGLGVETSVLVLDALEVVDAELVLDDKSIELEAARTELELVDVEIALEDDSAVLVVEDMEVLLVWLTGDTTVLLAASLD